MARKLNLFPIFIDKEWWEPKNIKLILHQKFATVLSDEDLSNADAHVQKGFKIRPRMPASAKASGTSDVKNDKDWFKVSLDLDGEFEPKEISVEKIDRFVEVRGKHEEKADQYGFVSREFFRRYKVPNDCDINALTSSLSSDYKLTIEVPKIQGQHSLVDVPVQVPVFEVESETGLVFDGDEYRRGVQQLLRTRGPEALETTGQGEPVTEGKSEPVV